MSFLQPLRNSLRTSQRIISQRRVQPLRSLVRSSQHNMHIHTPTQPLLRPILTMRHRLPTIPSYPSTTTRPSSSDSKILNELSALRDAQLEQKLDLARLRGDVEITQSTLKIWTDSYKARGHLHSAVFFHATAAVLLVAGFVSGVVTGDLGKEASEAEAARKRGGRREEGEKSGEERGGMGALRYAPGIAFLAVIYGILIC